MNVLPSFWMHKGSTLNKSLNVWCYKLLFESFGNICYNASVLKRKKWKCILSLQKYDDLSYIFNNCKDVRTLLLGCNNEFRNLFFIDIHEILQSLFEWIETNSHFKTAIKKLPLMEVVLLVSLRIEVGFEQGPAMNSIIFNIDC